MKYCPNCGQACDDAVKFCNNCGNPFPADAAAPVREAPVQPEQTYSAQPQQSYPAYAPIQTDFYTPHVTTKKEFLKLPENKRIKSELTGAAVICYICAAITLALGFTTDSFPLCLIDVAILVGMGLGIQLAQSRVCAIILLVYSIINVILLIAMTGKPGGYLIVIAGVMAVIYTFKAEKAWKQYQQGGV